MLLCEIGLNEIYVWFIELSIDAYDWVMVPNVYGMSQFAAGGSMVTKPYICSSAYILKMSDYKNGPWTSIVDGLYWRFVSRDRELFKNNPRTGVMFPMVQKLEAFGKLAEHIRITEAFLSRL